MCLFIGYSIIRYCAVSFSGAAKCRICSFEFNISLGLSCAESDFVSLKMYMGIFSRGTGVYFWLLTYTREASWILQSYVNHSFILENPNTMSSMITSISGSSKGQKYFARALFFCLFVFIFFFFTFHFFQIIKIYTIFTQLLLLLSRFSRVRLCMTASTAAHQAPPSLGFSRQKHWRGLPLPSPMHESEKWKWSHSVVSHSQRPHGLQPTRLLRPWDFPGKSTGVGYHCLLRIFTQ